MRSVRDHAGQIGVSLSRRQLLVLGATLPLLAVWRAKAAGPEPDLQSMRTMIRDRLVRDTSGAVSSVFGLDANLAGDVLLPATRADALPEGYMPSDVTSVSARGIPAAGRQLLRAIVLDDTRALIEEAAADGHNLYVGSGFRSESYQVDVFAAQVKRWGDEETANRYSARPGHSQHQLGTTIDFTNTFGSFRQSPAADWLRDNAHRFGFVLPYTTTAVPLTGYVDEPWHSRWVGRDLATLLQSVGYQEWTSLDADDVVALVRLEAALDA
jgi:zinc D-Ala-D-Ala carboxypeptidase